ncbi:MAG: amidohydrolase [Syntrophaceae bacterium]|nr:amidohydrolase [Syntrophaceae bacterium]
MLVIDTHCHCSKYYYEDAEVLSFQMNRCGVEKAVIVQHMGNYFNEYAIECVRRFPGRFAAVVIIDTDKPDAAATLAHWAAEGASGVRLQASTRSPGDDPLAIWRKAGELGLSAAVLGSEEEFASNEFAGLIEKVPETTIILEHLGLCPPHGEFPDEKPPYATYRKVLNLAKYPNTLMKFPGIGMLTKRTRPFRQPMPFENIPPFAQMAFEAFGPQRMMWGSNFPVCSAQEGYVNCFQFLRDHMTFAGADGQEWIFGKTALSVYFSRP